MKIKSYDLKHALLFTLEDRPDLLNHCHESQQQAAHQLAGKVAQKCYQNHSGLESSSMDEMTLEKGISIATNNNDLELTGSVHERAYNVMCIDQSESAKPDVSALSALPPVDYTTSSATQEPITRETDENTETLKPATDEDVTPLSTSSEKHSNDEYTETSELSLSSLEWTDELLSEVKDLAWDVSNNALRRMKTNQKQSYYFNTEACKCALGGYEVFMKYVSYVLGKDMDQLENQK